MAKKLRTGILFIEKDKFDIYLPVKKTIISYEYKPEILKDSEVLDREQLFTEVKSFIETNKLNPSSLVIVLGKNVLFEKDFIKGQEPNEQQQLESRLFIENVPFESVGSKIIPLDKGFRVSASNADLYESVMGVFLQSGFSVQAVLPVSLFGANLEKLTQDSAKIFLQKFEPFRRYSLVSDSGNFNITKTEEEIKKKKNSYMTILAISMFIVAGILVIYALFFLK